MDHGSSRRVPIGDRMRSHRTAAVFICFFAVGCTPTREVDVFGEYVARYSYGTEKLLLRSDRTYIQEVTVDGEAAASIKEGTWTYRKGKGALDPARVDLDHCLVVDDGFGRLKPGYKEPFPGICGLPVAHKFLIGEVYFDRGTSHPLSRPVE